MHSVDDSIWRLFGASQYKKNAETILKGRLVLLTKTRNIFSIDHLVCSNCLSDRDRKGMNRYFGKWLLAFVGLWNFREMFVLRYANTLQARNPFAVQKFTKKFHIHCLASIQIITIKFTMLLFVVNRLILFEPISKWRKKTNSSILGALVSCNKLNLCCTRGHSYILRQRKAGVFIIQVKFSKIVGKTLCILNRNF